MNHTRKMAFTLIELLVVIAIIGALMMLAGPTLAMARQVAEQTVCQSNIHQVTLGWLMFPADNKGLLVNGMPNDSDGWVKTGAGYTPIKTGKLYPYASDVAAYRCPSDSTGNERSFSIVAPLRGENWDLHLTDPNNEWIQVGTDRTDAILDPSHQLVMLEEFDSRGYNLGSWIMYARSGYDGRWIDFMATFHKTGTVMSFGDGHAEYWVWEDSDTIFASRNQQFFLTDPGSTDWKRVRDAYRKLPSYPNVP